MRSKIGVIKSKMGRKFEQKRNAKWVGKKSKFGSSCIMCSGYVAMSSSNPLSLTEFSVGGGLGCRGWLGAGVLTTETGRGQHPAVVWSPWSRRTSRHSAAEI